MSRDAFAALREAMDLRHRQTLLDAAAAANEPLIPTGVDALDRLLAGGFPRGAIATLEGPPSSGGSTIAARLLAQATTRGLGAVVCDAPFWAPALAATGVDLRRLILVPVHDPLAAARAADILVRSSAFPVVVIPALGAARGITAATWTRLGGLAHRTGTLVVALGAEPSSELRAFAALRLETSIARVRWNGRGLYGELAGYDILATVRKSRRTPAGGNATISCTSFEDRPLPVALRERVLAPSPAVARPALATATSA